MILDIAFLLRFALLSYAAAVFFAIGVGIAFSRNRLTIAKLGVIFIVVAVFLSLSYAREPFHKRLLICLIWTSLLSLGYRFGHKVLRKNKKATA